MKKCALNRAVVSRPTVDVVKVNDIVRGGSLWLKGDGVLDDLQRFRIVLMQT